MKICAFPCILLSSVFCESSLSSLGLSQKEETLITLLAYPSYPQISPKEMHQDK